MEAEWLAAQLEGGRSIESIARETGRAPSTVAYWVNKHGLTSAHAPRHASRDGLTREQARAAGFARPLDSSDRRGAEPQPGDGTSLADEARAGNGAHALRS
jgi:transposase-like protein